MKYVVDVDNEVFSVISELVSATTMLNSVVGRVFRGWFNWEVMLTVGYVSVQWWIMIVLQVAIDEVMVVL